MFDSFVVSAIRTEFFLAIALNPPPASAAIQVRLCRSELLIELDAHAILEVSESREDERLGCLRPGATS